MEKKIVISQGIRNHEYKEILDLIHDSFSSYLQKDIRFTCSSYTIDDIHNKVINDCVFIAENDEGILLGLTSIKKTKPHYAYENITAVTNKSKSTGVGYMLYKARKEYCKKVGIKYIISDTSVKATQSVNWHLKKCKCHLIGYQSYPSTNYYSYVFIECINGCSIIERFNFRILFIIHYVYIRLTKTEDGQYTNIGKIIQFLRRIL